MLFRGALARLAAILPRTDRMVSGSTAAYGSYVLLSVPRAEVDDAWLCDVFSQGQLDTAGIALDNSDPWESLSLSGQLCLDLLAGRHTQAEVDELLHDRAPVLNRRVEECMDVAARAVTPPDSEAWPAVNASLACLLATIPCDMLMLVVQDYKSNLVTCIPIYGATRLSGNPCVVRSLPDTAFDRLASLLALTNNECPGYVYRVRNALAADDTLMLDFDHAFHIRQPGTSGGERCTELMLQAVECARSGSACTAGTPERNAVIDRIVRAFLARHAGTALLNAAAEEVAHVTD